MQRILRRRAPGAHTPEAPAHPAPAAPPESSPPAGEAATGATAAIAPLGTATDPAPATAAAPAVPATPAIATPNGTQVHDAAPPAPAGIDPAAPAEPRPSFRERGRLRRRLRFLRRLRELGFRDLGGLVFDQHRFDRRNDQLVRGKLTALAAVDAELRALERVLDDRRPITELREPGISACARCGAVIASDARFCSTCGAPVEGARAIPGVGQPPAPQPPGTPALVGEQPTVVTRPGERPPA